VVVIPVLSYNAEVGLTADAHPVARTRIIISNTLNCLSLQALISINPINCLTTFVFKLVTKISTVIHIYLVNFQCRKSGGKIVIQEEKYKKNDLIE
jgi:hypothetical protein